jgi:ankyrin repeat protein
MEPCSDKRTVLERLRDEFEAHHLPQLRAKLKPGYGPGKDFVWCCAKLGCMALLQLLLDNGDSDVLTEGTLCRAIEGHQVDVVRLLVEASAKHPPQEFIEGYDISLHWGLRTAAGCGDVACAQFLLDSGADPRGEFLPNRTYDGSPLQDALNAGRGAMAHFLISKGALLSDLGPSYANHKCLESGLDENENTDEEANTPSESGSTANENSADVVLGNDT